MAHLVNCSRAGFEPLKLRFPRLVDFIVGRENLWLYTRRCWCLPVDEGHWKALRVRKRDKVASARSVIELLYGDILQLRSS